MMTRRHCETCFFRDPWVYVTFDEIDMHHCLRHAPCPKLITTSDDGEPELNAYLTVQWPLIANHETCGEWKSYKHWWEFWR